MKLEEFKKKYSIESSVEDLKYDFLCVMDEENNALMEYKKVFHECYGFHFYSVPADYQKLVICSKMTDPTGKVLIVRNSRKEVCGSVLTESMYQFLIGNDWIIDKQKELHFHDLQVFYFKNEPTKKMFNAKRKAFESINAFQKFYKINLKKDEEFWIDSK